MPSVIARPVPKRVAESEAAHSLIRNCGNADYRENFGFEEYAATCSTATL